MKQSLINNITRLAVVLLVVLFIPVVVLAGSIGEQTARQLATDFARQHGLNTSIQHVDCHIARRAAGFGKVTHPSFHVYNLGQHQGFVIVSGDDRTEQILGYADYGNFDETNMPENMRTWLQSYERQITYLSNMPSEASKTPRRRTIEQARKVIMPLIQTKWDQGYPYYNLCPKKDWYTCYTGCGATALAQLMYYYQWPQDATPAIPEYYSGGSTYDKYKNTLPELDPIIFDWANMLPKYESDVMTGDNLYTDEQATAVAQLMQYAGQSVRMSYGYNSSGSEMKDLAPALTTYFGYDNRTTRLLTRAYYSTADWEQKVYDELASGCPVLYDGFTDLYSNGHVFICDGYDGDGFFHINWGWSGNCDGYYRLSVLNPEDTSGSGASSSSYGYTFDQEALFGALPTSSESREFLHSLSSKYFMYSSNTLQLMMTCRNMVCELLDYEIGIGYYDTDGNLQTLVSQNEDSKGYGFDTGFLYFNDWNTLPQGSYVFYPMSRVKGSSQWDVLSSPERAIYAEVDAEHTPTLHYYADLPNTLTVTATNLEGSCLRGDVHKLNVTIKNDGPEFYSSIWLYGKYNSEDYTELTETKITIPANGEETVTLYFKPANTGNLSLVVTHGPYYSGYEKYKLGGNNDINLTVSDNTIIGDVTKLKAISIVVDNMTVEEGKNVVLSNGPITGRMTIKNEGTETFSGQVDLRCFVPFHDEYDNGGVLEVTEMQYPAGQFSPMLSLGPDEEKVVEFTFEMQSPTQWWHSMDGIVPETIYHRIALQVADEWPEPVLNGELTVYPYYGVTITHSNGTSDIVSYKQEIIVPPTAVYVDLRGFSGNGIVLNTTSAQPNCLYLRLGSEEDITGLPAVNVIKGNIADQIALTDGYDFIPPFDFTAHNITYTRTASIGANNSGGGWQTMVLPFATSKIVRTDTETQLEWFKSAEETGKNLWIKDFVGINGTTALFGFAPDILEAYHPYIIAVPDNTWGAAWDLRNVPLRFESNNAQILADSRSNINTSSWKYTGTMTTSVVNNVYAINDTGTTFKLQSSATMQPFSAWFVHKSVSSAGTLNIGSIDESITAIHNVNNAIITDQHYYNLNGQRMGSGIEQLPRGIYIYQGKKIRK